MAQSISNLLIFHNYVVDPDPKDRTQRVVIRNNTDVFLAVANVVKSSAIGSSNYHLTAAEDFVIRSLVLSPSGNHLAVIGDDTVHVYDVLRPRDLRSSRTSRPHRSHRTQGISGSVRRVAWCECAALDVAFAVLQDDGAILVYDLAISQDPVATLGASNFDSRATCIAFGPQSHLPAAVSLYVATAAGSVYVVAPALDSRTEILATAAQIDLAYADAAAIAAGDAGAAWKRLASDHVRYFSHLRRQVDASTAVLSRDRRGREREYFRLAQAPGPGGPIGPLGPIQGPIASIPSPQDLLFIGDLEVPVLMAVDGANDMTISYWAQYQPVVLWAEPSYDAPAKSDAGYAPPTQGFGFVDVDSDDEGPEPGVTPNLDLLSADVVRSSEVSVPVPRWLVPGPERILVASTAGAVVCTPGAWLSRVDAWHDPVPEHEVVSRYDVVSIGDRVAPGFAVVKDDAGFSGDYVVLIDYGAERDVEVVPVDVEIDEESTKPGASSTTVSSRASPAAISSSTHSLTTPTECSRAIDLAKEALAQASSQVLRTPKASTDLERLQSLNQTSSVAVGAGSHFHRLLLHTGLAVAMARRQLQVQVDALRTTLPVDVDPEISRRVETATADQSRLAQRLDRLQARLVAAIQDIKTQRHIPLSARERQWIHTVEIMMADEKLARSVEELQDQVRFVVAKMGSGSSARAALGPEWNKVRAIAAAQGKEIADLRDRVRVVLGSGSRT